MIFYTYMWLRENGTPYYVGKGQGNRGFTSKDHRHKCPPIERIVIYPAKSEKDAYDTEIDLIWYYGRKDLGTGCLRNLTDGGENPPSQKGVKISEETREKRRKNMLGNTFGRFLKGRKKSQITKDKIGAGNKGKVISEETKLKMSAAKKGKPSGAKGKHWSPDAEGRRILSEFNKGKPWSLARRAAQERRQQRLICA